MKKTIFDRLAVVKVAKNFSKEYEMDDRIDILSGNYSHDFIDDGYDLIWAGASLNFARHDMDSLMKQI